MSQHTTKHQTSEQGARTRPAASGPLPEAAAPTDAG